MNPVQQQANEKTMLSAAKAHANASLAFSRAKEAVDRLSKALSAAREHESNMRDDLEKAETRLQHATSPFADAEG